jgi:hypothetical protein
MSWAKYADNQTKYVIAHPGAVIAAILMFAFVAGERVAELFEKQHSTDFHLIFTLLLVLVPAWWAYFVVQAIRELRHERLPVANPQ